VAVLTGTVLFIDAAVFASIVVFIGAALFADAVVFRPRGPTEVSSRAVVVFTRTVVVTGVAVLAGAAVPTPPKRSRALWCSWARWCLQIVGGGILKSVARASPRMWVGGAGGRGSR